MDKWFLKPYVFSKIVTIGVIDSYLTAQLIHYIKPMQMPLLGKIALATAFALLFIVVSIYLVYLYYKKFGKNKI